MLDKSAEFSLPMMKARSWHRTQQAGWQKMRGAILAAFKHSLVGKARHWAHCRELENHHCESHVAPSLSCASSLPAEFADEPKQKLQIGQVDVFWISFAEGHPRPNKKALKHSGCKKPIRLPLSLYHKVPQAHINIHFEPCTQKINRAGFHWLMLKEDILPWP